MRALRCVYWRGLTESRRHGRRPFTSGASRLSPSSSHDAGEAHRIRCGSSGFITVDIYNSHILANPSHPLILYLPPTGVSFQSQHPVIPSFLLSHPLARINYRWNHLSSIKQVSDAPLPTLAASRDHPFPTPLHDTLEAYTWLTTQYLVSFSETSNDPPSLNSSSPPPSRSPSPYAPQPPRTKTISRPIILYGSHLGGTLATSLALTECRDSRNVSFNIAGLIVTDGVLDWTGVATSRNPLLASPHEVDKEEIGLIDPSQTWTTQTLHNLKQILFPNPSSCFDSFASPTLFFRTPGLSIPRYFPGTEPPPTTEPSSPSVPDTEHTTPPSLGLSILPPSRKSHLKFPPRDSGLKIPPSLFLTTNHHPPNAKPRKRDAGSENELGRQADEMARLMRRSIVMHEFKERVMSDEDVDPHQAAEERVQRVELRNREKKKEEGRVVAAWLEDREGG